MERKRFCFLLIVFSLFSLTTAFAVNSDPDSADQTDGYNPNFGFYTPAPDYVFESNIHGWAPIYFKIRGLLGTSGDYVALLQTPSGEVKAYNNIFGTFYESLKGTYYIKPTCTVRYSLNGRSGYVEGPWVRIFVVDNTPPARPTGLTIVRSPASHPYLTWNKNTERDVDHYDIYKRNPRNWQFEKTGTTSNNYYEDLSEIVSYGENPEYEGIISYRVIAYDVNGNFSAMSADAWVYIYIPDLIKAGEISAKEEITCYGLEQNYPNPFNPVTQINYQIKSRGMVILKVYDMLGKEVTRLVNEIQEPGRYSVQFNASDFPSGTYIYSLRVNDFVQNSKMVLLK